MGIFSHMQAVPDASCLPHQRRLSSIIFTHMTCSCGQLHICLKSAIGVHGAAAVLQVWALSAHLYAVRDFYFAALDAFLPRLWRSPPAARLHAHERGRALAHSHALNLTPEVPAVRKMGAGDMTNGILNIVRFHLPWEIFTNRPQFRPWILGIVQTC